MPRFKATFYLDESLREWWESFAAGTRSEAMNDLLLRALGRKTSTDTNETPPRNQSPAQMQIDTQDLEELQIQVDDLREWKENLPGLDVFEEIEGSDLNTVIHELLEHVEQFQELQESNKQWQERIEKLERTNQTKETK